MTIKNFFRKKTKHALDETSQIVDTGINERLTEINGRLTEIAEINERLAGINGRLTEIAGINESLAEINERLRKIENRQKETGIQLDEIDGLLQGGGNEPALLDAVIMLIDSIGDFHYFASEDEVSPLAEQSMMMWNTAINAAETAGIELIAAAGEPFDFTCHSVESTEQDDRLPNGYVIKTLKCGYIYKGEIMRRASVVVNKGVNTGDGQIYQEISYSPGSVN